MSQVNPTDELSNSVSKLVELNKQITEAREDIKVLTQAEKSLKLQVKKLMTDNGLDVINLKKGKISVRKSSRKTGLNKTSVKEGLISFYEGNEQNICEIGTRKPRRLHCVTFACDIFFILLR